jgi:hypothetical protein
VEGITGAQLAAKLGAALDLFGEAVEDCRALDTLTSTDRKRVNAVMDDLACEHERVKLAHQRMLERAQLAQGGLPR